MPIKDLEKRKKYQTDYHRDVWYPKNKARRLELLQQRRNRIREHINNIKRKGSCVDCNYDKNVVALDFDHLGDDKLFDISSAIRLGYSIARIDLEIAKCELVCANCHRIRTQLRLNNSAPIV